MVPCRTKVWPKSLRLSNIHFEFAEFSLIIQFAYHFRKEQLQKQREYLKQKKQKKLVKMKEMEEARETEKNKWQTFNAKVSVLFTISLKLSGTLH